MASATLPSDFLVVDQAPRIGFGLAAIGRPGYINLGRESDLGDAAKRSPEELRQKAWELLDRAWALGIRYFDCARSYGRSEEFLAGWLKARSIQRHQVAVGSKWGYRYTADWQIETGGKPHEVKDHSLAHLQSQLLETQNFLGDHLKLYQVHSATLDSGILDDAAVLADLKTLREKQGWRIGLSLSGVKQAETLEKALESGIFDAVQATWNLLEQSVGEALLRAKKSGLDVIVKEGMANGRLLTRPSLTKAAERMSVAPDALALGAVMAQPFQPMVLSGAVTEAQLDSNFAAASVAEQLRGDPKLLKDLMEELRMDPAAYWKERSELPWT
eukprot:TRINITY_DN79096_c0_g1_i1.p1 TRINITY_DN79096_c0_g1~~TRINITY_DN79096_c0_g1_i1.p1  ORF type:complete len:330 (-),score=69.22 TRINITY_DN79096_c0_g1_i1:108-1097(-)